MPVSATETALHLFVTLMRASRSVGTATEPSIVASGLTPIQFGVLEALRHRGPLSHRELCVKVLTSPGNLTDVIDKLEARGLLARRRETVDARRLCISLTPDGTALIDAAFPPHAARITAVMAALSAPEQAQLAGLLRRLGLAAAGCSPK